MPEGFEIDGVCVTRQVFDDMVSRFPHTFIPEVEKEIKRRRDEEEKAMRFITGFSGFGVQLTQPSLLASPPPLPTITYIPDKIAPSPLLLKNTTSTSTPSSSSTNLTASADNTPTRYVGVPVERLSNPSTTPPSPPHTSPSPTELTKERDDSPELPSQFPSHPLPVFESDLATTKEMSELEDELEGRTAEVPAEVRNQQPPITVNLDEDEEDEEDEVPLIQRSRALRVEKRPLESSDVQVPSPKRLRKSAPKKVPAASVTKPASKRKQRGKGKELGTETEEPIRPFIDHLVIDEEFLTSHGLAEVLEILKVQQWSHLYKENCTINTNLARQFFNSFTHSGLGTAMAGRFKIEDAEYTISFKEMGQVLGVPIKGLMEYHKKNWPSSYDKDEIVKKVTGLSPTSSITTMSHDCMDVITKSIYMYTICNVVPRKEGREKINIEDYLLINQLLQREQISLPAIFMKHIEHAKSVSSHGIPFAPLIKKILEYEDCYTEGTAEETETLGKPLDMRCLSQALFKFEDGTWSKVLKAAPPQRIEGITSLPTAEPQGINFMTMAEISRQMTTQFKNLTELVVKMHEEQCARLDKVEERLNKIEKDVQYMRGE